MWPAANAEAACFVRCARKKSRPMSFIIYDIVFLALFAFIAVYFGYKRRRNLKRQGWIFLYHAKWGLSLMDSLAKKHARILRPLQYIIVAIGYLLLGIMCWLLVVTVYDYVTSPFLAEALKIPPLLPLFPYFPQIFKIESIFPPFYFTYFLIAIAIVAISHEFAHGLFARLNKVRIKSTGLAFFGPFFGAFVEQDDRDMKKIKKFPQLAILAAGVFANVLMMIAFGALLWAFFAVSFAPAGVNFNTYTTETITIAEITHVNGVAVAQISDALPLLNESLFEIESQNIIYFVPGLSLKTAIEKNIPAITVYDDAPAIRARLKGTIVALNGSPTRTLPELRSAILASQPNETIVVTTLEDDAFFDHSIRLGERDGKPYLGIGVAQPNQKGIKGAISRAIYAIKDPFIHYEPTWGGDFAWFVYYLLWWVFMINLLVALFNMLPLGMLDGGRFFYITIWGITGKEVWGKRAFTIASWFFIALLALMMVRWFAIFF